MGNWKRLFYYSRSQRIGIALLLGGVVAAMVVFQLKSIWKQPHDPENDTLFVKQLQDFELALVDQERAYSSLDFRTDYHATNRIESVVERFQFDPNTLDSAGFVRLGLRPFMAKNIVNYRAKGGKFRNAEDFSKIYGLQPELFAELRPYIAIVQDDIAPPDYEGKPLPALVELNNTDTTALQLLPGIGSYFSKRIISYGKQLGGYASVDQLLEIKNFSAETLERNRELLTVDASAIERIEINRATVDRLKRHPYINFYQAKAIYDLRRKNDALQGISDLEALPEFDREQLERLAPYLDFSLPKRDYRR